MRTDDPVLEICELTKSFGRSVVVDRLNISLKSGTTLAILGPNGAGKSTTLRMILGMLRPTSGSVSVFGQNVLGAPHEIRKKIGFVPEVNHAYRWMTVQRLIFFCKSMYEHWDDDRCACLLDKFQIAIDKRVGELSKGTLAKLSLLLALSHHPELLVLDEPMSGLDPIAREDFLDGVLEGICSGQQTVVFSSHQLDEVSRLADEVAIVNDGRLLIHDRLDSLIERFTRVRAVLHDGRLPEHVPSSVIHQTINRRLWEFTAKDLQPDELIQLHALNPVADIQTDNLSLAEIFRDLVRSAGPAPDFVRDACK